MDSEDRQVLSLDSQEHELISIAEKNALKIIKTFKESRTAKDSGRPLFNEMVTMLQSGKADAILCWKLDRLAEDFRRRPHHGHASEKYHQRNPHL